MKNVPTVLHEIGWRHFRRLLGSNPKMGLCGHRHLCLDREPDNPHDPNAIRVSLFGIYHVGYLPRDAAQRIAPLMDTDRRFLAEFVRVTRYPPHERVGMMVRIVESTDLPMT